MVYVLLKEDVDEKTKRMKICIREAQFIIGDVAFEIGRIVMTRAML